MKRFISVLLVSFAVLAGSSFRATAQVPQLQPVRAGDTLTNTDTLTKEFYFTDGYSGVIITPVVTKLSGTPAGTVYFYVSPNGVDYPTTPTDSLVLANVATRQFPANGWRLTAPVAYRCKAVFITAGTQSYKTQFYILTRKYAQNVGGAVGFFDPEPEGMDFAIVREEDNPLLEALMESAESPRRQTSYLAADGPYTQYGQAWTWRPRFEVTPIIKRE